MLRSQFNVCPHVRHCRMYDWDCTKLCTPRGTLAFLVSKKDFPGYFMYVGPNCLLLFFPAQLHMRDEILLARNDLSEQVVSVQALSV